MADEDDLRDVAPTVLTHRIVINFAAEAAGRTATDIVGQLLKEARWQPK
jgi:MoxR-like ATPase